MPGHTYFPEKIFTKILCVLNFFHYFWNNQNRITPMAINTQSRKPNSFDIFLFSSGAIYCRVMHARVRRTIKKKRFQKRSNDAGRL